MVLAASVSNRATGPLVEEDVADCCRLCLFAEQKMGSILRPTTVAAAAARSCSSWCCCSATCEWQQVGACWRRRRAAHTIRSI